MAARTYNYRSFLPALCAVMQSCQIVRKCLQRVNKVIQILNFSDWFKTSQCKSNALPYYRTLANTCICHPQLTVFLLKTSKALVNISDLSYILSKCKYAWVSC